jgi:hypothetical protein
MEEKSGIDLENIMTEYMKTYGTDVTYSEQDVASLEHKIFYLLHSRERIEEQTFKGNDAKEWVAKYGPENAVFKESEVLNFMKKHKIK